MREGERVRNKKKKKGRRGRVGKAASWKVSFFLSVPIELRLLPFCRSRDSRGTDCDVLLSDKGGCGPRKESQREAIAVPASTSFQHLKAEQKNQSGNLAGQVPLMRSQSLHETASTGPFHTLGWPRARLLRPLVRERVCQKERYEEEPARSENRHASVLFFSFSLRSSKQKKQQRKRTRVMPKSAPDGILKGGGSSRGVASTRGKKGRERERGAGFASSKSFETHKKCGRGRNR